MKVLFLTMAGISNVSSRGIYTDLLRTFRDEGHEVVVMSPIQRRENQKTFVKKEDNVTIVRVRTLNVEKASVLEKGIGQLLIEQQFLKAVKKFLKNDSFDLVLYSTPPITFSAVIKYVKKRDNAYAYLLLKDIFPQNAVDMGMIRNGSILHRFFKRKERKLYALSDTIGCMSPANKEFLTKHNPEIAEDKIEINPNTIVPIEQAPQKDESVLEKYNLPIDKKIFVYGGNLGVPQGLDFLLDVIEQSSFDTVHFLIVGSGTQYLKLKAWFSRKKPSNATLFSALPKEDYDRLLGSCDVGLIFLHPNFSIPNFPSRLLSYLEMKMPVIAATDENTDIGSYIENYRCGFWVKSGDIDSFMAKTRKLLSANDAGFEKYRENARQLLFDNFTIEKSYNSIMLHMVNHSSHKKRK